MSLNLNLNDVKEQDFEVLPAGDYKVSCTEAKVQPNKAGTGEYINCQFKVLEGQSEGRVLFVKFNINNPSEDAQRIGLQQLKGYMKAAGFTDFTLQDVADLEGRPVMAHVKHKTSADYGTRAEVSYFKQVSASSNNAVGNAPF